MSREKASLGRNRTTLEYRRPQCRTPFPVARQWLRRPPEPATQWHREGLERDSQFLSHPLHDIVTMSVTNVKGNLHSMSNKKESAPAWIIQGPERKNDKWTKTLAVAWWRVISATSQLGAWIEKVSDGSLLQPHCYRGISLPSLTLTDTIMSHSGYIVKCFLKDFWSFSELLWVP